MGFTVSNAQECIQQLVLTAAALRAAAARPTVSMLWPISVLIIVIRFDFLFIPQQIRFDFIDNLLEDVKSTVNKASAHLDAKAKDKGKFLLKKRKMIILRF